MCVLTRVVKTRDTVSVSNDKTVDAVAAKARMTCENVLAFDHLTMNTRTMCMLGRDSEV